MFKNSHRYGSRLPRSSKLRLRYVVLPTVALALFVMFMKIGGEPVSVQNRYNTQTTKQKTAVTYNTIAPAAGDSRINFENLSTKLQHHLPKTSKNIHRAIEPKGMRLSAQDIDLPITSIAKPSKKPFLRLTETQNTTKMGHNITKKTLRVSKGDTLGKLLERGSIGATQAYNITTSLAQFYNPKDMQIGQELTVFLKDSTFKGLDIKKDLLHSISLRPLDDGRYGVMEKTAPTKIVPFVKQGTINSSLYRAALDQNMPDGLIVEMIHIYSWAIDFQRDIQPGDQFKIMYNMTLTEDGKTVPGASEISYISLNLKNAGEIALYRYQDTQGDIGYYEPNGHSVRKALMKTPINGARLSSGFGMRKHPVLGYSKMHKGIDFAASRGTPIYAAGDGRIVYIGNKGGYGKYIRIRHHSGLETAYAHMRGFKKGLRKGARVQQGKIIGYVGTTGRSTGPHLHYEILSGGRQVNPRKLKMQKGKKLAGTDLEMFQGVVEQTQYQFAEQLQNKKTLAQRSLLGSNL